MGTKLGFETLQIIEKHVYQLFPKKKVFIRKKVNNSVASSKTMWMLPIARKKGGGKFQFVSIGNMWMLKHISIQCSYATD